MTISKLIKSLQNIEKIHGDIQCVVEALDFSGKTISSTVETLVVADFLNKKAVKLDWRT